MIDFAAEIGWGKHKIGKSQRILTVNLNLRYNRVYLFQQLVVLKFVTNLSEYAYSLISVRVCN